MTCEDWLILTASLTRQSLCFFCFFFLFLFFWCVFFFFRKHEERTGNLSWRTYSENPQNVSFLSQMAKIYEVYPVPLTMYSDWPGFECRLSIPIPGPLHPQHTRTHTRTHARTHITTTTTLVPLCSLFSLHVFVLYSFIYLICLKWSFTA